MKKVHFLKGISIAIITVAFLIIFSQQSFIGSFIGILILGLGQYFDQMGESRKIKLELQWYEGTGND